eukprot:gene8260-85_t
MSTEEDSLVDTSHIQEHTPIYVKDEEVDTTKPPRETNIFLSIFNLANAAIGMGVFAFPFTYQRTGVVSGLLLTSFLVVMAALTLYILVHFGGDARSYQEVVKTKLGKIPGFICELILIFYLSGGCIAYLNIVGDTLSPTMAYWFQHWRVSGNLKQLADRRFVIILVTVVVILPITFFKNMKWLGIASVIAIFSAAYTVVFVDVKGLIYIIENQGFAQGTQPFINLDPNFLISIPLICLSFQCHIHVIPVYAELKKASRAKMIAVIIGGLLICFTFYASVGFFGYVNFGSAVEGNVIRNYEINDMIALFARLTVATLVALSYPLRYFATRKTIESLFFKDGMEATTDYLITTIFVILTILLSMFIPDITDIFGIIGSIGAVSLMFIFPGMLLWTTQKFIWRVCSVTLVVFGMIMGIAGTVVTMMDIVSKYRKLWEI